MRLIAFREIRLWRTMLNANDALAFIETARQQQQPIFGVDSFVITETTTQPMMEHILDLSVGGLPDDTWSEAHRFVLERRDLGFMFEVVV
ncbi:hypothetical protein [Nodosilinea sp. FACHB-13]|uniref:hypothetical protein n=1 Tax=Cyanophyceae TaxID=3028117 RepID=UPI0016827F19|nr:hypothetical protein [Nodosilinea sp. FACHB-13]MBD2108675.1 hypothetical protein [Nodosilinea sp. FACHB-13]